MPVCKICGEPYLTINGLAKTFNICKNHTIGPYWCGPYYTKSRHGRDLYWTDPLTKNIISNKRGPNDASVYLCKLMYKELLKIIEKPIYKEFPQYRLQLDDLLVIPVPNHESDSQKPASYLAKCTWFLAHAPAFPVLIATRGHDASRKAMSPEARYEFDLKKYQIAEKIMENKDVIRNKNILLIDDLYVHGSTVKICSSILLENGAKRVIQLCAGKSQ